jgi:RsiW-degrading membrane proteinase PrsW (M82 family)
MNHGGSTWHRFDWVLVLVGGETFYQAIRRVALHTQNSHLFPGLVLIGSLIVPVSFVTFLRSRSARHDVTLSVALTTALAGGCFSIALAAGLEQLALDHSALSAPVVGVVEEVAKLIVTAAVLGWLVPCTARNGLLVGASCGAGFSVVETLGYVFVDYLRPDGGLRALNSDLLDRSLLAPATHLTWAALTGCALGLALPRLRRWTSLLILVGTLLVVTAMHATWDARPGLVTYLALSATGLALLTAALSWTRSLEGHPTAP